MDFFLLKRNLQGDIKVYPGINEHVENTYDLDMFLTKQYSNTKMVDITLYSFCLTLVTK